MRTRRKNQAVHLEQDIDWGHCPGKLEKGLKIYLSMKEKQLLGRGSRESLNIRREPSAVPMAVDMATHTPASRLCLSDGGLLKS